MKRGPNSSIFALAFVGPRFAKTFSGRACIAHADDELMAERAASETLFDEDDDEATSQFRCVDCGVLSPPTRTSHTLISAKHGWRLTRTKLPDGSCQYEWRCLECFSAQKAKPPSV